jgi:hypothetical protein
VFLHGKEAFFLPLENLICLFIAKAAEIFFGIAGSFPSLIA